MLHSHPRDTAKKPSDLEDESGDFPMEFSTLGHGGFRSKKKTSKKMETLNKLERNRKVCFASCLLIDFEVPCSFSGYRYGQAKHLFFIFFQ